MRKVLTAMSLAVLAFASPVHAIAAEGQAAGVSELELQDGPVRLTLNFDRPIAAHDSADLTRRLGMGVAGPVTAAGPDRTVIDCSESVYFFTDRNGTVSFRFNCKHDSMNWGFKIKPELQAIATGDVKEIGARWWVNGSKKAANSPHTEPAWYHFHGSFGDIHNGDDVDWYDSLTFPVKSGGVRGSAHLEIGGSFEARE